MNHIEPTPTYGITTYFQGRPNTIFLQRYATPVAHKSACRRSHRPTDEI